MRLPFQLGALGAVSLCMGCSETTGTPPASNAGVGGGGVAGTAGAAGSGGAAAGAGGSHGGGGTTAGNATAGGAGGGGSAGEAMGGAAGQPSTLAGLYCRDAAMGGANPVAGSPQPSLVAIDPPGGISFLEGPVWLAARGVLLLSEWNQQHRILQLTPPTTVEVFLPTSRTNGLILAPDGESLLVVREAPGASLSQIQLADKSIEPLVEDYEGQAFTQPNDLAVRADGTIFFTDYQAGRLYRRAIDGDVTLVTSATHANGVGISPDESTLYLNSDAVVLEYPLSPQSELGEATELTSGLNGADGLAIDCAGNVYVAQNAGGGLRVVSPAGEILREFSELPETVTNAAFGGANRQVLYITTSSALYSVELPVVGLPY